MFAQANSEHCRHKIFNADWIIDGARQPQSLFAMIRHTHAANPQGTVVAYADNARSSKAASARRFFPGADGVYRAQDEPHAHRHQVRDAQPSDRDLALSGRGDRLGRRDPRRRRDRARRQAQGRAGRLLGVAPAHPGARAALGGRTASASPGASPPRSTSCSTARSARPRSTTSSAGRTCAATSAPSSTRTAATTSRSCSRAAWAASAPSIAQEARSLPAAC